MKHYIVMLHQSYSLPSVSLVAFFVSGLSSWLCRQAPLTYFRAWLHDIGAVYPDSWTRKKYIACPRRLHLFAYWAILFNPSIPQYCDVRWVSGDVFGAFLYDIGTIYPYFWT